MLGKDESYENINARKSSEGEGNNKKEKRMSDQKSNIPLPKGKENTGPRVVPPVNRPSKAGGMASYAANSSPNLNPSYFSSSDPNQNQSPLVQARFIPSKDPSTYHPKINVKATNSPASTTANSSAIPSASTTGSSTSTIGTSASTVGVAASTAGASASPAASSGIPTLTYGTPVSAGLHCYSSTSREVALDQNYSVSPGELTSRLLQAGQPTLKSAPVSAESSPSNPAFSRLSPLYLSSKKMPGIHDFLLAKMKENKRRSLKTTPNRSPCRAPATIKTEVPVEEVFLGCGESESSVGSVSSSRPGSSCSDPLEGIDLDTNLRSLFKEVDEYRAGVIPSRRLLAHLLSYVEAPQLDQWKIDELSRLLDPTHDNRFVDEEQFLAVGRKWAEMIMGEESYEEGGVRLVPEVDLTCQTLVSGTDWTSRVEREVFRHQSDPGNVSYGSMEGVGGTPGCDSREVELENRCSELRFQLYRQHEDYQVLQSALASAEDVATSLTGELEAAKVKISALSTGLQRASHSNEEGVAAAAATKVAEDKCCNLSARMEEMKDQLRQREEKLEEREEMCTGLQKQLEELARRREDTVTSIAQKEADIRRILEDLEIKEVMNQRLESVLHEREEELQQAGQDLQRLEAELRLREDEIRNLTLGMGGVLGHQSVSINGASILDVSVDDKLLEDMSGSNSPTPRKLFPPTPSSNNHRGPSASSTPNRAPPPPPPPPSGSIGEELTEVGLNARYPSPLCGKAKDFNMQTKLQVEIGRWQESVRRAIIEEAEPSHTGKLISAVNKAMDVITKDILAELASAPDELVQENHQLHGDLLEVRKQLNQCKEDLKKEKDAALKERDRRSELDQVEQRVLEMVNLLQMANRALLAAGQSVSTDTTRATTPVEGLEHSGGEDDFSVQWQLDLDGIELIEWNNNLSRKLLQYSRRQQFREDGVKDKQQQQTGERRLWLSSLYNRLEELHIETEKSRDLLLLAGDSMREDSLAVSVTSPPSFPKTQSCQTEDPIPVEHSVGIQSCPTTDDHLLSPETVYAGRRLVTGGGLWSWLRYLISKLGSRSVGSCALQENPGGLVDSLAFSSSSVSLVESSTYLSISGEESSQSQAVDCKQRLCVHPCLVESGSWVIYDENSNIFFIENDDPN